MLEPLAKDYQVEPQQAFDAALKTVLKLHYKVSSIDKANGLLQFKTQMSWKSWAGQDMSVLVMDNGKGGSTVDFTGARNTSGVFVQVYDWGEAAGIAKKVLREMDKLLST